VTWRDPLNGLNGAGKWKQIGGIISIDWSPSGSNDSWNWPPTAGEATGTADVEGEGCFIIAATRL
jgi:hypothetical protein